MHEGPIDEILVDNATFSMHSNPEHLKDNGVFGNYMKFLHRILHPCLMDMQEAQQILTLDYTMLCKWIILSTLEMTRENNGIFVYY